MITCKEVCCCIHFHAWWLEFEPPKHLRQNIVFLAPWLWSMMKERRTGCRIFLMYTSVYEFKYYEHTKSYLLLWPITHLNIGIIWWCITSKLFHCTGKWQLFLASRHCANSLVPHFRPLFFGKFRCFLKIYFACRRKISSACQRKLC